MKLLIPLPPRLSRFLNMLFGLPKHTVHVRMVDLDKPPADREARRLLIAELMLITFLIVVAVAILVRTGHI